MSIVICDIESDGPVPHLYSMVSLGAVILEPTLSKTFYCQVKPISEQWKPDALAISGFTREQHLQFDDPESEMKRFHEWVKENSKGKPTFMSDTLSGDWSFTSYYLHRYVGENIFGYGGRRFSDLYCGFVKDYFAPWKQNKKPTTAHHPTADAIAIAELVLELEKQGLNIPIK